MPFTLAHGAAALPFRRTRLIPSAVLIGTFAPDFEYFLMLAPVGRFGHTLLGALVLTLPLSFAVLWLFQKFVKRPVIALLPDSIEKRLASYREDFRFGGVRRFSLIILSLMVGIATHILWDSFTHGETWLFYHWALLREPVYLPVLGVRPLVRALQHISTVVGTGLLAVWCIRWYSSTDPSAEPPRRPESSGRKLALSFLVIAVALIGAMIRVAIGTDANFGDIAFKQLLAELVVTSIALAWWQLVAYGAFLSMSRN